MASLVRRGTAASGSERRMVDRIALVGNRGEQRLRINSKTDVDGFDPVTNTAYEFDRCYHHGCTSCFKSKMKDRGRMHRDLTFGAIHEVTRAKH